MSYSNQPTRQNLVVRSITLLLFITLIAGCATTSGVLPFAVQSDPLGAHVLFKAGPAIDGEEQATDWIYLGVTPIDLRRELAKKRLKSPDAFTMRVLKDGYLEQRKTWGGKDIKEQMDGIGKVFWNPRLVRSE